MGVHLEVDILMSFLYKMSSIEHQTQKPKRSYLAEVENIDQENLSNEIQKIKQNSSAA